MASRANTFNGGYGFSTRIREPFAFEPHMSWSSRSRNDAMQVRNTIQATFYLEVPEQGQLRQPLGFGS
jgi:hypothetical protein